MTIRQLQMLELWSDGGSKSLSEVLKLTQTTFGSLCYHKWIEVYYSAGKPVFFLSESGLAALTSVDNIDLYRKHVTDLLTSRIKLPQGYSVYAKRKKSKSTKQLRRGVMSIAS